MSIDYKKLQEGAFGKLDKRRQKAVALLFDDELTDEEIAKSVNRSRQTLSKWKKEPTFIAAQEQYKTLVVSEKYESAALRKLYQLLNAKSEMVQLQAATTILKLANRLSDNSNPELDKVKIKKGEAEARTAEAKAILAEYEVQIKQEEFGENDDEERDDDLQSAVGQGMEGLFGNGDEIET
ncbi:phBC6A51 family helix-turn-helix protein [Ligilactobacillus equi]|uniref:Homeodomain phBC6A51-type domain-containing protein n=1 Tax=Ligilactobacillus equi DSM 15833 = JCM 10991 TaxID=1423740 RepID=A0A0R1TTI4_9LACO|nr:phBC6A51 family helix-turn-helix protein [Ligilactobacillus equi]KRL81794.1 hypothetical protein FC36_GL001388 [Ligilactobacillus equi DSM 15833 = JCM 10991]